MPGAVLAVASAVVVLKLLVAARTFGTDDVRYWIEFCHVVATHGPIGVYQATGTEAVYNHPPLMGWVLLADGKLGDLGISLPFLLRLPACIADLVTTVLIWKLLDPVWGRRAAAGAAIAFASSPVAFVISGFHGNTDPLMVMFVLLSAWVLVSRRSATWAGVALGLAVSVKVVAVVCVPVLLVLAYRRGQVGDLGRCVLGGACVFGLLWVPALLLQPSGVVQHVLGYAGTGPRQWGLSQIAVWSGASWDLTFAVGDAVRFLSVLVATLLPAALAWRAARTDAARLVCVGLPLVLMLLLSPAFSMQYLVWPLAAAYLVAPWTAATLYNLFAGLYVLLVYSGWNEAPPWQWYEARSALVAGPLLPLMALTFAALCLVAVRAFQRLHDIPHAPRQASS